MKKYSAVSAMVAIAVLSACSFAFQGAPSQPKPQTAPAKAKAPIQTFVGVISDGQCAAKGGHKEIMQKARVNSAANCVKGCSRRYGYVLYDPATKKIYKLNDQERPAELAAKRVKIKGALDKTTQTIYVSSIEPAN
jgi:putative hemolysin